jgi:hypothetical protein
MADKNKPVEPRTILAGFSPAYNETEAVRSPVGEEPGRGGSMRSLNMGKKSKATSPAEYAEDDRQKGVGRGENGIKTEYKKGGKVVKCPYDGIAEKGKTRAKFK